MSSQRFKLAAAAAIAGGTLLFAPAERASAQTPCVANATTLCLNNSRFKVSVNWQVASIRPGMEWSPGSIWSGA